MATSHKMLKVGVPVALAVGLAASAGVAYASADYAPTTLGNPAYSNHVDTRNDYGVAGIDYTAAISKQNQDTAAAAQSASAVIGTQAEGVVPILVTNDLGADVTAFAVRSVDTESFSGNLLNGTIASGGQACWWFVYDYAEVSHTNNTGKELVMPVNYTIEVTLSDGTTAQFHDLNMNGVRTLTLCHSDAYGVYFAERTTVTNHTPDPNLYYEVNLAETDMDPAEFDYHVNSAGRMDNLMYTASRGKGWELDRPSLQEITDFGIELPLYGTPEGEAFDDVYQDVRWNADGLAWRDYNND